MTDTISAPRAVSRFEFDLLRLLRFLLGYAPAEQSILLLANKVPMPPCLSSDCIRLVKDTLAKGVVLRLVRTGGWRQDMFLDRTGPKRGRVWNRRSLPERTLAFSGNVIEFLMWLTAEKPNDTKVKWDVSGPLTPADELFFALALDALRYEPLMFDAVRYKQAFANNPFCWLLRPADVISTDDQQPPTFHPLFEPSRTVLLECLQPMLTDNWTTSELNRGKITDWKVMRRVGHADAVTLGSFLAAAEKANRTDLARFLLKSMATVFKHRTPDANFWTGGLSANQPNRLADRLSVQRLALAVPQQADTLARWDRKARGVGYFDEEYQSSQVWKEDFEAFGGADIIAKCRRALDQLEPLRVQTTDGTG